MNAEPPTARFQTEHQTRRPGFAKGYPTVQSIMNQRLLFSFVLFALVGCAKSPKRLSDIDVSSVQLPDSLESVLNTSHATELLSLNPEHLAETPTDNFHRWEILGRAQLDGESAIKIIHGLKAGVATEPGYAAACFNPRHGLRLSANKNTIDVVICFECAQIYVYENDVDAGTIGTSDIPLTLFNQMVTENELPMPPPANP